MSSPPAVGLITDHSYLPAPSFKGMRRHLLERFSTIYIFNFHGNSRVREVLPPDVAVDDNIFDIQQGTAISIMIREAGHEGQAEVYYADIWGDRRSKYDYLSTHDATSTTWMRLQPEPPLYLFVPRELPNLSREYERWPSIPQLMPLYSQAIVTARDKFVIDFDRSALIGRIVEFAKATGTEDEIGATFGVRNTREFDILDAKGKVAEQVIRTNNETDEEEIIEDAFIPVLYRPFDARSIYYHNVVIEWPREDVMKHLLAGDNSALKDTFGQAVTPEDVFFYVYGVLNSPGYLAEFEALLQHDYPRIPFPADYEAFIEMSREGQRIALLHLLEAADLRGLANLLVGFPVAGSNVVERVAFEPAAQHVYINKTQYFEGVTEGMWNYKIGAYNPLEKWLDDRRRRTLTSMPGMVMSRRTDARSSANAASVRSIRASSALSDSN